MRWRGRAAGRPPGPSVAPGERLLASATAPEGADPVEVGGTRDALYVGEHRIPWEQVEGASWDLDEGVLTVREVGTWGHARPEHELRLHEPVKLLELVRERVTASIVWQRHVPVRRRAGLRVIARRAPGRHGEISWVFEFDEGVDPDDPVVRLAADEALREARDDVGLD